jgi:Right handed beta helix region
VEIQAGADPVLRRNQIHRNGYAGVWADEAGKGVIEDNDLTENAEGARTIARGYARNVTRARNKE